ncbi:uncharacterized protein TNCV_1618141 [Trichonephila clavipes]|nr:uncharacterized protein TNCV_1618141 [Trichonephila clavipes]
MSLLACLTELSGLLQNESRTRSTMSFITKTIGIFDSLRYQSSESSFKLSHWCIDFEVGELTFHFVRTRRCTRVTDLSSVNQSEPNKREKRQVEETGKTSELPKKTGEEEMPEEKSKETFRDELDKDSEILKEYFGIFMQSEPNKREKRQVEKTGKTGEEEMPEEKRPEEEMPEDESDETFRDKLDKVSQVLKEYFGIFMQKQKSFSYDSVGRETFVVIKNFSRPPCKCSRSRQVRRVPKWKSSPDESYDVLLKALVPLKNRSKLPKNKRNNISESPKRIIIGLEKSLMYETPVATGDDLIVCIVVASADIASTSAGLSIGHLGRALRDPLLE